ncbi:MAG: UDP-galactopyranose mutase, partial [Desulfovibrionaceae bacterium]
GMTGASAARWLAESGARVLVIDAREHAGGNCYDVLDAHGLRIHLYGPHIFHTSRPEVVDFLSRFTPWRPYEHRVVGLIDNRLVPLPINLTSIAMLFPGAAGQGLVTRLVETFGYGAKVPILALRASPYEELADLAAYVYARVFEGYTRKQWGLSPEDIDPAITGRVPVRVSYDDRYFTDSFQCMPAQGFSPLFSAMLQHKNITLRTGTAFATVGNVQWKQCIYTGPMDEYWGACHGCLPYRSLDFVFEHYAQEQHLPVGVVNYPHFEVPFTRISEYRHLTGQQSQGDKALGTTVSLEYPRAHEAGATIPYYPIRTEASVDILHRYQLTAQREAPNIVFAGRLGAFAYLNMDEAVLAGLAAARRVGDALRRI